MDLPRRIKQHKAESDSYAILLYKLRDVGIFRNLTDNDYGIDFEIELVKKEKVTGKYLKAQVKSSDTLTIRKSDSVPTVGGIKQSTLNYWAELSYKTHVIAYAVDISTEVVYISKPIFWQAIKLIDGSNKTKSIEFTKHDDDSKLNKPLWFTILYAESPSLMDQIYSHKMALKYLPKFFSLYNDAFHYDTHMPINEPDVFETFLEVCKILLWSSNFKDKNLTEVEVKGVYSLAFWKKSAGAMDEDVYNFVAHKPLRTLMPELLKVLRVYEKHVFESKYYWKNKSPAYLKLVYDFPIPNAFTHEEIIEFGDKPYNNYRKDGGFPFFIGNI